MKKRILTAITIIAVALSFMPMMPDFDCAGSEASAAEKYIGTMPVMPTGGETIAAEAKRLAFPYGTPKSQYKYNHKKKYKITKYDEDRPVAAFKTALDKYFPEHWEKWGSSTYGYAPRVGASCDVFVGTVVRSSGYDPNMPRGLSKDVTYLPKTTALWKKMKYPSKVSDMKPGDVIIYYRASKTGHVYIYVGDGRICDAGLATRFGIQRDMPKSYYTVEAKTRLLFRPIGPGRGYWKKGDSSEQVKLLQKFLTWAGFYKGSIDGSYGAGTENAVKALQKAAGLSQTGKFDAETLAAAKKCASTGTFKAAKATKKATKKKTKKAAKKATKKAYTGKLPSKTVAYHKGTKQDIKYWQAFLKWYGYSLSVDGDFGEKTRTYTKKFQKANKLTADGQVGPLTRAKAKKVKK